MTNDTSQDKWTAFVMSLAVPGAGQLLAGSWSCLAWFGAAGMAAVTRAVFEPTAPVPALVFQLAAWAILSLSSAEHAKRCLEPHAGRSHVARSSVSFGPARGANVDLRIELEIVRPHDEVWKTVADLPRFACVDPFHSRVIVMGPQLRAGVDLTLEHRAFGLSHLRFGRLLKWRERCGYAFSDLSARGSKRGFPHVFFLTVEPLAAEPLERSCVRIHVRGKWTAWWTPRWIARLWLWYIATEHVRLLRSAF